MKKIAAFIIGIFACLHAYTQSGTITDTTVLFDQYLQKGMKDWQVPGLAIVVIRDNEIIFKKSYGTPEINSNKTVNDQTMFACASTTKAMTAVCMAMLVDEGKLSWDDPVIKYLPSFRVYDAYTTRDLRVRDLFLHNSGVGNADYLWADNNLSQEEILQHMEMVKPSYPLRAGFIYQNIFYLVAGKVIESITGMKWEDFVTKRIFQPLGMTRTVARYAWLKDDNIAKPHYKIADTVKQITTDTADAVAPAGAVYSCINDISLWVKCMLDSSKYAGGSLVKPGTWTELLKPQTIVTDVEFYPTQLLTKPHFKTYAFGWFQQDYRGEKLNFHTGSLDGMIAITGQMPDKRTAVYIFANLDHAELRHALMLKAFDVFAFGDNHRDWSAELLTLYGDRKKQAEKRTADKEAKRVQHTGPSLPLKSYTGVFEDPLYGLVEISLRDSTLIFMMNHVLEGKLEHWNYDTYRVAYTKKTWYPKSYLSFSLDTEGKVKEISFDETVFRRKK